MAEPELLVDQPDRFVDRGALVAGDADVGKGQELEDIVLVAPDRAKLILRPAALEIGDDLFLAIPFIGPVMGAEIMFEHVDRRAGLALELELIDVHFAVPGPLLFTHESALRPPKAQGERPATTPIKLWITRSEARKLWISSLRPPCRD